VCKRSSTQKKSKRKFQTTQPERKKRKQLKDRNHRGKKYPGIGKQKTSTLNVAGVTSGGEKSLRGGVVCKNKRNLRGEGVDD